MTPTWPDGTKGPKTLYRWVGPMGVGQWRVEDPAEPQPDDLHYFPDAEKQTVPVYPASYVQELVEAAGIFADSVERDLHEPDKLLCHLQTVRRAFNKTGEQDG